MPITFKVKDLNEEILNLDEFNIKSFLKQYYEKQSLTPSEYYYHQLSRIPQSYESTIDRDEKKRLTNQAKEDKLTYENSRIENVNNLLNQVRIIDSSFKLNNQDGNGFNINGLKSAKSNSFVQSCWEAYNNHHHLEIRPDDVYMAIMVQFSFYINKHSITFRDRLIDFQGKQSIQVVTSDPILEAQQYGNLTLELVNKMKSYIKDPSITSWLIPEFTTTTPSDKVAFASVLLSTMKPFFNYSCHSKCGLPSVTLLGTVDDWSNLKERLQKLKEFNIDNSNNQGQPKTYKIEYDDLRYTHIDNVMDKWVSLLEPVIDQFILTASGSPNLDWWNSIVDYKKRSGGDTISGWLSCFLCFTSKGDWMGSRIFESEWPTIYYTHIANGYVTTPILLIDSNGKEYNSTLFSGHIAAATGSSSSNNLTSITTNSTSIRPSIDWFLLLDPST